MLKMKLNSEIKNYIIELTTGLYKGYQLQLDELSKKLNLRFFLADFDDKKISGVIIKDEKTEFYNIYVNRKDPPNRRRFTFAHEIGHYISFKMNSYSKDELIANERFEDYAMSFRHNDVHSKAETEANQIAAEILMPEKMVKDLVKQGLTAEEMADQFYVSPSAMIIRLQTLYDNLMIT